MEQQNEPFNLLEHDRVQQILESSPLLVRQFSPQEFRNFILCGELEEYDAGETIVSEKDDLTESGWLIAEGSVSLFKEDVFLARLQSGDFIGETFLFKRRAPAATLVSTRPTALIRFDRKPVLDYFNRHPERLFKIFIVNLVDLQNQKLVYAGKKILYLQRKLKYQTNSNLDNIFE
ncbi:MAG: cyclic nucleotide-binding domain-containing protein [Bacteroidetes bacterium]|jgi:CRP-like cAMP-binding protein|nr:cyclic nucleotide-binding domain-containing protein [Bacteroidota bacterium]